MKNPARTATRLWLLVALPASIGCAPAFQTRAQNVTVVPARIASVPVFTMAYELDFNGNRKPLDAWADAMTASLDPEIGRWVVGSGGHPFPEQGSMMVPLVYRKFRKWTAVALMEIAAQKTHRFDYKLYSVDKWAFDQDLEKVREMLAADFVLVSLFKDARQTTGRVVGSVLGGMHTYWLQVGAACLVDLNSGRMVWCNAKSDAWPDLSEPASAKRAVAELLTDLYYPPKPAAAQH